MSLLPLLARIIVAYCLLLFAVYPATHAQEPSTTPTGTETHSSPFNQLLEEDRYYSKELIEKTLPSNLQQKTEYAPLIKGESASQEIVRLIQKTDLFQSVTVSQEELQATQFQTESFIERLINNFLSFIAILNTQSIDNKGFINLARPQSDTFPQPNSQSDARPFKEATKDLRNSLVPHNLASNITYPSITPIPPGPAANGLPAPQSQKLNGLIKQAAVAFSVPPSVLAAVAWTESWSQTKGMWEYMDSEIEQYSASGAISPLNPNPNGCRAVGPMQFVNGGVATDCGKYTRREMPDIWQAYANAVNEATGENRTPNPRNIKDAIYAAAKKLKDGSGTAKDNPSWNETAVRNSIQSWYGSCEPDAITEARFGKDKGFCDFVWEVFLQSP